MAVRYHDEPGELSDGRATRLSVELPDVPPFNAFFKRIAHVPKIEDSELLELDYIYILLILGAIVRHDGTEAVMAFLLLRGVFTESFIEGAFNKLASLGYFDTPHRSIIAAVVAALIATPSAGLRRAHKRPYEGYAYCTHEPDDLGCRPSFSPLPRLRHTGHAGGMEGDTLTDALS